jgi:hypothetical protein
MERPMNCNGSRSVPAAAAELNDRVYRLFALTPRRNCPPLVNRPATNADLGTSINALWNLRTITTFTF